MKLNDRNIITDSDISVTGYQGGGKNLSDILSSHRRDLEKLKSNMKWIYRHGGVGSGMSGGNGGSGGTASWKVVVTRVFEGSTGGLELKDGVTMNFGQNGNYPIKVQVYNGRESSFRVTFNYTNSLGNQGKSRVVTASDGFQATEILKLDKNGLLGIEVLNQDTQDIVTLSVPYITSAYSFELVYVKKTNKSEEFTSTNNNIFMSDVSSEGLVAALKYTIATGINDLRITYNDWDNVTRTIEFKDGINNNLPAGQNIKPRSTGIIYLDLLKSQDIITFLGNNGNSGYRQFLLGIDLILEGNNKKEEIPELSLKDNLIPSEIYLKVTTSSGSLYGVSQGDGYSEEGKFKTNVSVFRVTPYMGSLNPSRSYRLTVKRGSNPESLSVVQVNGQGNITLSDQKEFNLDIPLPVSGEQYIQFNIRTGDAEYTTGYWMYVKETESTFSWYPKNSHQLTNSSYYRRFKSNGTYNIPGLSENVSLNQSINGEENRIKFSCVPVSSTMNEFDQLLCLGIQYTEVNDQSVPILSFNTDPDNGYMDSIVVYQNKVVVNEVDTSDYAGFSGQSCEIFLPQVDTLSESDDSGFHLLSIYKRLEKQEGNNYFKTIYVYLDGILEGVFRSLVTVHYQYKSVTLFPGNYYINLLDSSVFKHSRDTDTSGFMTDTDILGYYYKYAQEFLRYEISDADQELYRNFSRFTYDRDNFVTVPDPALLSSIAKNSSIPTLVLNFVDNGTGIPGSIYTSIGQDNIRGWLNDSYSENSNIAEAHVTVQWSGGKSDLFTVSDPENTGSAATFSIVPQGSSTLGYRAKNLELKAPKGGSEYDYLYSPNYDDNNPESFLPEESFTLKADIVDSSHTNNNAIGSFVNKISTPFFDSRNNPGQTTDPKKRRFIKNCLTGFPVMVFLSTLYKSGREVATHDKRNIYFLGIYNFNLGRNSFFNLGYKSLDNLGRMDTALEPGFKVYKISKEFNGILGNVKVGEIQGNNPYFDFSQYHESVLFKIGGNDSTYMWGDLQYGSGGTEDQVKNSIRDFCKRISKAGGYIFDSLEKTYSESAEDSYGYDSGYSATGPGGESLGRVPNYRYQATRYYEGSAVKYRFDRIPEENASAGDLLRCVVPTGIDTERTLPAVDYNALCEYYTVCMAFGLIDSVQKNLNIKSWSENNLFYPAFYDMDTCLGVSNSGDKVDFFAFSDFWKSGFSRESSGITRLNQSKVYRDFAPKDSRLSLFDTPSSYLFAIAKYASILLSGQEGTEGLRLHPSNLWAIWRSKDGSSSLDSQPDIQRGCLRNSKYFVETFFKGHTEKVPLAAFNHNYRYKYLVKDQDGRRYDTKNFSKFHGRKLAYTESWLAGRLHLLDTYFNLAGVNESLVSDPSKKLYSLRPDEDFLDRNNPDIYILRDIFSNNPQGEQYSNLNHEASISSKPYSPLVVKTPNTSQRYIFPGKPGKYVITLSTSGNQATVFGGSSLWTGIDTINPFITHSGSFRISSRFISTINGDQGVCSNWDLDAVGLKDVVLVNNSGFTGQLDLGSSESRSYPNLRYVNISGTGIQLSIDSTKVRKVYAEGMKPGSSVRITNVGTLEDFKVSGDLTSLSIPAWGREDHLYLPTGYQGDNSKRLSCSSLVFTKSGADRELTIIGNKNLQEITITGVYALTIRNCPSLKRITLNDDKLRSLYIVMPVSDDVVKIPETFTIGGKEGVVDLSRLSGLQKLVLRNCNMTQVILPPRDMIFEGTRDTENGNERVFGNFEGSSKLKYLTTNDTNTYWIKGRSLFRGCSSFTLKKSESDSRYLTNLKVHEDCRELSETFYCSSGSIDTAQASHFLKNLCDSAGNVTKIDDLFRGQTKIKFSKDQMASEYRRIKEAIDTGTSVEDAIRTHCTLPLGKFKKVENVFGTFWITGVQAIHRYMFTGLGSQGGGIDFTHIAYPEDSEMSDHRGSGGIFMTVDTLYDILPRISRIASGDHAGNLITWKVVDKTGGVVRDLKLRDIFHNDQDNVHPEKLKTIYNIDFHSDHDIDLTDTFNDFGKPVGTEGPGEGISIDLFLYRHHRRNGIRGLSRLFRDIRIRSSKHLVLPDVVFEEARRNREEDPVNMAEFFRWEDPEDLRRTTSLWGQTDQDYWSSLGFKKYIHYQDLQRMMTSIIKNGVSLESLGVLFKNCYIVMGSEFNEYLEFVSDQDKETTEPNTRIKHLSGLFQGAKFVKSLDNLSEVPVRINSELFKYLPSLTRVPWLFYGTFWKNPIPFDLFYKRTETRSTVYVNPGSDLRKKTKAYLITYDYRRELEKLRETFYGVRLENAESYNPEADYNCGRVKRYKVTSLDGDTEYDHYYQRETSNTKIPVTQGTEITDSIGIVSQYNQIVSIGKPGPGSNISNVPGFSSTGTFCSPDILYGVTGDGVDLTGTFKNLGHDNHGKFTGTLPKNLLKNCPGSGIEGTLTGLKITPTLVNTRTLSTGVVEKNWSFVPEDFTRNTSLKEAFKFVPLWPSVSDTEINTYVILLENSIPDSTTTLEDAFPEYNGSSFMDITGSWGENNDWNKGTGARINIMGRPEGDQDNGGLLLGIDTGIFRNLKFDNLINPSLVMFFYGKIFLNDILFSPSFMRDTRSCLIRVHERSDKNGVSGDLRVKFPVNSNKCFIRPGAYGAKINKLSVTNISDFGSDLNDGTATGYPREILFAD